VALLLLGAHPGTHAASSTWRQWAAEGTLWKLFTSTLAPAMAVGYPRSDLPDEGTLPFSTGDALLVTWTRDGNNYTCDVKEKGPWVSDGTSEDPSRPPPEAPPYSIHCKKARDIAASRLPSVRSLRGLLYPDGPPVNVGFMVLSVDSQTPSIEKGGKVYLKSAKAGKFCVVKPYRAGEQSLSGPGNVVICDEYHYGPTAEFAIWERPKRLEKDQPQADIASRKIVRDGDQHSGTGWPGPGGSGSIWGHLQAVSGSVHYFCAPNFDMDEHPIFCNIHPPSDLEDLPSSALFAFDKAPSPY